MVDVVMPEGMLEDNNDIGGCDGTILLDKVEVGCKLVLIGRDGEKGDMWDIGASILRPRLKKGGLDLMPLIAPLGGGKPPPLLNGGLNRGCGL